MKATYKGHTIEVNREKCLGGWSMIYYSVFRDSDGFECVSSFEDSAETVRGMIKNMKERIDNELKEEDPWCEKSGVSELYFND